MRDKRTCLCTQWRLPDLMQGAYEGMLRICILPTAEYMLDLCNSKIFCQEATSLQEELPDISLKKKFIQQIF